MHTSKPYRLQGIPSLKGIYLSEINFVVSVSTDGHLCELDVRGGKPLGLTKITKFYRNVPERKRSWSEHR